uniref:Secreted protein n=1 Tax=Setaria viridis TaxID=4556 RepID=A0A4U6UJ40_SETVI|nr:hypothetical protein SEVIR_5G238066v2 [Setaria viridis]
MVSTSTMSPFLLLGTILQALRMAVTLCSPMMVWKGRTATTPTSWIHRTPPTCSMMHLSTGLRHLVLPHDRCVGRA